jgi:hypothetical protein
VGGGGTQGASAGAGGGSTTGSGGTGSAAGGAGGVNEACLSTDTDNATPVTIRVRNDRTTSLYLTPSSGCDERFLIKAPSGETAPWWLGDNLCTTTTPNCPQDCFDEPDTYEELPPGVESVVTWDGHLVQDVDAAANQCPYAQAIGQDGCFGECQRLIDAPAGMYELNVFAWTANDWSAGKVTETVTLDYPATTDILVVFPPP